MQHHIRSELALPARFAALVGRFDGDTLRPLQSALEVLLRTPDKRVPAAIVHGDFAPWNIGLADDEKDGHLFVYDWECGRLSGLPLIDALHFLLQTLFLLHDASPQGALRRIAQLEGDPGYRGYACAAGLDASAGRTVLLAYLVDAVLETLERDAAGGGRLRFHRLELLREVLAQ